MDVIVSSPFGEPLRHKTKWRVKSSQLQLLEETIENPAPEENQEESKIYYDNSGDQPVLFLKNREKRILKEKEINPSYSILSQIKDPTQYLELDYLTLLYSRFKFYREWSFGRSSVLRTPQPADMPRAPLEENFSNLGMFLNHLRGIPQAKKQVIEHLRDLYDGLEDFDIRVQGGAVEVFLTEGDFVIPASRLSDGTLRYLCLLAILCDPEPPPLICIEEPELGLHPDLLPKIADLLVAASERTQLVVTTHSDILVDALSDTPEAVVVVEKHNGQTVAKRLDPKELSVWLEKYRLGQLWTRGHIGGTRW
jgi:predicted ATPase